MKIMDERAGEIRVIRGAVRSGIEMHIRGSVADAYPVIRLTRQEARHLAALILLQAERAA